MGFKRNFYFLNKKESLMCLNLFGIIEGKYNQMIKDKVFTL